MSTKDNNDALATQRSAICLGYAGIFSRATWLAARKDGEAQAPELFAEITKQIEAGQQGLAIFVQRIGDEIRVTAAVTPPEFQDCFGGPGVLDLTGPMIKSPEQLNDMVQVSQGKLN